ncbi:MAG TPA: PAS domain-containing protein [Anaerolineales bacterium]|nr:PAS domain-containing protein [Anaerolineales bacterium]
MPDKSRSSTQESKPLPKLILTDEEKLILSAKASADAIYDWDMVAGLTTWNHGLQSLFGYDGDSVKAHGWWEEHIHPEDKDRVIKSITTAHVTKADYWTDEYRFRRADETYAFVVDRGYFIYDDDQKPLRQIGAVIDITSRVALAEAQAQSAIEERQRLARDLHDSVSQTLYSLTLIAEATRRLAQNGQLDQVIAQTERLRELSQQSLKEMRLLIFELRLPTLEREGLAKALQQRLDAVEKRAGVDAKLIVENVDRLPVLVEEGLFYMAYEALNNSLKHAAATKLTISLRAIDDVVELQVVDNGKGFDVQSVSEAGGMGLTNLRDRAQKLKAQLEITSIPEKGTTIKIAVHLNEIKESGK